MIARKVGQCEPGMIVAKDAYSGQGVLLLRKGVQLSEKSLWVLKCWGVTKIWVEGQDTRADEGEGALARETELSIVRDLEERFAGVLDDDVMAEIMTLAAQHLKNRYREGHEPR